jgi:hypothetical protein
VKEWLMETGKKKDGKKKDEGHTRTKKESKTGETLSFGLGNPAVVFGVCCCSTGP